MLNREFLINTRMPLGELVKWIAAARSELTPFEAKLFELIERMAPAHVDDEETEAETLKELIDLGVMADSFGYDNKKEFERIAKLDELMSEPDFWDYRDAMPGAIDYLDDLYKQGAAAVDDDKSNVYAELLDRLNTKLTEVYELIHV